MLTQDKNNFKENSAMIEVKSQTAVFYALFGLFNLRRMSKTETPNQLIVTPRLFSGPPFWSTIKDRMSRIIHTFDLKQPETYLMGASDYFLCMLAQMKESSRFTEEQITHLEEVVHFMVNDEPATMDELFKMALAFDDGHGISLLKFERVYCYSHKHKRQHYTGEGLYATREAMFNVDMKDVMDHAELICKELANGNDLKEISYEVCVFIAHFLYNIRDLKIREALIKQVAKDLPKHAKMIYSLPVAGCDGTEK
ncbi:MAG: hypothetical protein ACRCWR_10225 [Saezia sp.]